MHASCKSILIEDDKWIYYFERKKIFDQHVLKGSDGMWTKMTCIDVEEAKKHGIINKV
jgi:hypothetical protein